MQNIRKWYENPLLYALGFILFEYLVLILIMDVIVKYDPMRGDILSYWNDSLAWQTPYNPIHVPLYPLLIALIRGITNNNLGPITVMRSLNFIALVINTIMVYKIILLSKLHPHYAAFGTIIFNSWIFIGLTQTVAPLADNIAFMFFLGGFYYLRTFRFTFSSLFFSLALVTHKALWPFVLILLGMDFVINRSIKWWKRVMEIGILILPLSILWLLGYVYYDNFLWIFPEFGMHSVFEGARNNIFGAVISSFQPAAIHDIGKGSAIIAIFALTIMCIILSIRSWNNNSTFGLVLSSVCMIFLAIFSYREGFYIIRFSRLLVIPLFWSLPDISSVFRNPIKKWEILLWSFVCVSLFCSQIVFTIYLPVYYEVSNFDQNFYIPHFINARLSIL